MRIQSSTPRRRSRSRSRLAAVEDNEDPATNAPISDRLQLTLANTGEEVLGGFEIYYEMTDATTGSTEGYYQRLDGLEIAPGEEATIYFDNETGPGHYPENEFSIYRSSVNQVDFAIEVSAVGCEDCHCDGDEGSRNRGGGRLGPPRRRRASENGGE